jgi:hypothetical protein
MLFSFSSASLYRDSYNSKNINFVSLMVVFVNEIMVVLQVRWNLCNVLISSLTCRLTIQTSSSELFNVITFTSVVFFSRLPYVLVGYIIFKFTTFLGCFCKFYVFVQRIFELYCLWQ